MGNDGRITARQSPRLDIDDVCSEQSFTLGKETHIDSDVVVVEPSFDVDDSIVSPNSPQLRFAQISTLTSPLQSIHRRDLAAHFFDAATDDGDESKPNYKEDYPVQSARPSKDWARPSPTQTCDGSAAAVSNASPHPAISPAESVGHKHRRGFSGGASNPPVARRRTNLIGDSAEVDRHRRHDGYNRHYPSSRAHYCHKRTGSAGLDILSSVADGSKEQFKGEASRRYQTDRKHWNAHCDIKLTAKRRMDSPQPITAASSYESYLPHNHSDSYAYNESPAGERERVNYYRQAPANPFYPPGAPQHYGYLHPSQQNSSYPVQYAPLKDSRTYLKGYTHPPVHSRKSPDDRPYGKKSSKFRGGITAGVQTSVTALDAGDDCIVVPAPSKRTMGTNTDELQETPPIPTSVGHHRKLSSYSSLGTLMGSVLFPDPEQSISITGSGHNRSESSTVSLLRGIEGGSDMFFLQNIQTSAVSSPGPSVRPPETPSRFVTVVSSNEASGRVLAVGGASKRIRRKCTVALCQNRVVQGGLCISHGAKRKTCKHPGCIKNVKKAGLCSTHGPARKRCEAEDCNKVAVQGGRCVAHGAKKKPCEYQDCTKQAILAGMCKRHHDLSVAVAVAREGESDSRTMIDAIEKTPGKSDRRPSHTRGLSIFQEISAESVQTLLSSERSGHPLKDQKHPLKDD